MKHVYLISPNRVDSLQKEIKRLAKKFGQDITPITIGDTVMVDMTYLTPHWWEDDIVVKEERVEVFIDDDMLYGLDDIRLIAKIEDNIISNVPGQNCPEEFRNVETTRCDVCGVKHARNIQYIVCDSNEKYSVVGSSCLQDIFGTTSGNIAAGLEQFFKLVRDFEEDSDSKSKTPSAVDINTAIQSLIRVVDKHGFISVRMAEDSGWKLEPTGDQMYDMLFNKEIRKLYAADTELSVTVEEFKTIVTAKIDKEYTNSTSNFIGNLYTLIHSEEIRVKHFRFFASIWNTYAKAIEETAEKFITKVDGGFTMNGKFFSEPSLLPKDKVVGNLWIQFMTQQPDYGFGMSQLVVGWFCRDSEMFKVAFYINASRKGYETLVNIVQNAIDNGHPIAMNGTVKSYSDTYSSYQLTRTKFME